MSIDVLKGLFIYDPIMVSYIKCVTFAGEPLL